MPALTIPSPPNTHSGSPTDTTATASEPRGTERSRSRSPDRPPVSPITPTLSVAQLAPVASIEPLKPSHVSTPPPTTTFRKQPPSVPISESENPDAIALRSAISLLQLQREKSKRDLKTLQDLKTAAVADPEAFARHIQSQRKQSLTPNIDPLSPTLSASSGPELDSNAGAPEEHNGNGRKDSTSSEEHTTRFPAIPQPQNIIRCPPINWAKYHIVGEPLDKMHEEQRRWPGSNEPPRTQQGNRAPPHAVASPYSPFTDGVSGTFATQGNRGMKKSPS